MKDKIKHSSIADLFHLSSNNAIGRLLWLRNASILVQLVLIIGYGLMYSFDETNTLSLVIASEVLFQLGCIIYFRKFDASHTAILIQILADIVFLTSLLMLTGGATNAFVSLLLIPIVIAAVSLPFRYVVLCSLCAIGGYSYMIYGMPMHVMHHLNMHEHFIAMWINFLLSVCVVTFIVGTLMNAITSRQKVIAKHRERQLRAEQLIALGAAAAQVTHQMATPLATLAMLIEELEEELDNHELVTLMSKPLGQCKHQLNRFREYSEKVRENKTFDQSVAGLVMQVEQFAKLEFPDQSITSELNNIDNEYLKSDVLLLPAIFNLLENAVNANRRNKQNRIVIGAVKEKGKVKISITDLGDGIEYEKQKCLGQKILESDQGLGIATLLSNATIERLGGRLKLNHTKFGGVVATVELELVT